VIENLENLEGLESLGDNLAKSTLGFPSLTF